MGRRKQMDNADTRGRPREQPELPVAVSYSDRVRAILSTSTTVSAFVVDFGGSARAFVVCSAAAVQKKWSLCFASQTTWSAWSNSSTNTLPTRRAATAATERAQFARGAPPQSI